MREVGKRSSRESSHSVGRLHRSVDAWGQGLKPDQEDWGELWLTASSFCEAMSNTRRDIAATHHGLLGELRRQLNTDSEGALPPVLDTLLAGAETTARKIERDSCASLLRCFEDLKHHVETTLNQLQRWPGEGAAPLRSELKTWLSDMNGAMKPVDRLGVKHGFDACVAIAHGALQ